MKNAADYLLYIWLPCRIYQEDTFKFRTTRSNKPCKWINSFSGPHFPPLCDVCPATPLGENLPAFHLAKRKPPPLCLPGIKNGFFKCLSKYPPLCLSFQLSGDKNMETWSSISAKLKAIFYLLFRRGGKKDSFVTLIGETRNACHERNRIECRNLREPEGSFRVFIECSYWFNKAKKPCDLSWI